MIESTGVAIFFILTSTMLLFGYIAGYKEGRKAEREVQEVMIKLLEEKFNYSYDPSAEKNYLDPSEKYFTNKVIEDDI